MDPRFHIHVGTSTSTNILNYYNTLIIRFFQQIDYYFHTNNNNI